ncbi:hypothetical protein [Cytobacillus purgationiresistens]|uniref:Uncharacterized protein n=1 Tax=Cytobacillus purgationiresistens TaxID=863449 RepID=A0ABU0AHQ8_9BACI|nr:hypothetical protein [Cytobacillus purgationiresistens]MDQ0270794.1 hypothetical protein [Cytobacillus purgationiresistens]
MAYGKVEVRLYTKAKGWFGRERFNQIGTGCSNYGEKEWNYDYIRMAINEVIGYENDNKGRQKHRASQKKAAEAFEKWDGIEVAE